MPTLTEKKREVERIGTELGVASFLQPGWSSKLIAVFDTSTETPLGRTFVDYVQNEDVRCASESVTCFLRRVLALDESELISRDLLDFVPIGALREQSHLIADAFKSLRGVLEGKLLRLASASLSLAQKKTVDDDDAVLAQQLLSAVRAILIAAAPLFDPTLKAASDGATYVKHLLAAQSAIESAYTDVGALDEAFESVPLLELLRSSAALGACHVTHSGVRPSRSASPGRSDRVKLPMDAIDNIVKKAVDGASEKFTKAIDARPQVSLLDVFFPAGVIFFITTTYNAITSAIAFLDDLVNRSGQMVLMGVRGNALSGLLDYPAGGVRPSWYTEFMLGYVEVTGSGTRVVHTPTIIQTYLQWNDFIFSFPRVYWGPYGLYTAAFIVLLFFAVRYNSAAKSAAKRVFTTENLGRAIEIGGRVVRLAGKGLTLAGDYFETRGAVVQTLGTDEDYEVPKREQRRRIAHPISASRSHSPPAPRL
jgi:hypothetical protein